MGGVSHEFVYRWSLLAVGIFFLFVMIAWMLVEPETIFTILVHRGVTLAFAFALIALGFWLGRSTDDARVVGRTAAWGILGGGVMTALASWAMISSHMMAQPYPNPTRYVVGGAQIGILAGSAAGFYHEVSRRQAEQLAKLRGQRLEQVASTLSHDVRSPLSVAYGHLRKARAERDDENEHLESVERSLERIQEIVDDTMLLVGQGGGIEDTATLRLGSFADQCWGTIETAEAQLVVESDVSFRADRKRAAALLQNVFRNAVKHGGEDITIVIGRHRDGFFVEDDGPGIPPEVRERIFELGYAGDSGGTGLGLAIVNEIAVEHGWEVTVSRAENGGARFEIRGVTIEENDRRQGNGLVTGSVSG